MTWEKQILNLAKGSESPEIREKARQRLEALRLYGRWLEKRDEERRQRRSA